MRKDELAAVEAWYASSRIVVLGLLFLSSMQFLSVAIIVSALGQTPDDKLIFAGSLLFAAVALAAGLAFRKVGAPTWKHKVVVALITLPAALSILAG